jgi:hypothetical protein
MRIFIGKSRNKDWLNHAKRKSAIKSLDSIFGKGQGKKALRTKHSWGWL